MHSQSTKIKWMPKTGQDSICNSTGKEKASITAPNLWSHQDLYKLDREWKKTTEEGAEDCLQKHLKLQNGASKALKLMALPCAQAEAERGDT